MDDVNKYSFNELRKLAQWRPVFDQLYVLPFLQSNVSAGRIVVPGRNLETPEMGLVLAVGPGGIASDTGREVIVRVPVGKVVLHGKYAGISFDNEGPDGNTLALFLIRDMEVLGVQDYDPAAMIVHDDDVRKMHLAGRICDHEDCPPGAKAERARLLAEAEALLAAEREAEAQLAAPVVEGPSQYLAEERERVLAQQRHRERTPATAAAGLPEYHVESEILTEAEADAARQRQRLIDEGRPLDDDLL